MAKATRAAPQHPGVTVEAEILRLRAGDQIAMKTAATALGVPVEQLLGLVRAKTGITPIWALRLSRVLGRPPAEWMAMQAAYDLWKCEQAMGDRLANLKPLGRGR